MGWLQGRLPPYFGICAGKSRTFQEQKPLQGACHRRGSGWPGCHALFPCSTGAWVPPLSRADKALWRTLMKFREPAKDKSGGKAGVRHMAMTSAAPKRIAATKKSAPVKKGPSVKKSAAPAKKAPPLKKAPAAAKKTAAKKPAPAPKKEAPVARSPAAAPAAPRPTAPLPSAVQPPAQAAKPVAPAARPSASAPVRSVPMNSQSAEERRKAVTRKFFARLRSLEAIIGADLRKRGSVVLMQAVDQWYSEAISATATDVSITNAAKVVIAHL